MTDLHQSQLGGELSGLRHRTASRGGTTLEPKKKGKKKSVDRGDETDTLSSPPLSVESLSRHLPATFASSTSSSIAYPSTTPSDVPSLPSKTPYSSSLYTIGTPLWAPTPSIFSIQGLSTILSATAAPSPTSASSFFASYFLPFLLSLVSSFIVLSPMLMSPDPLVGSGTDLPTLQYPMRSFVSYWLKRGYFPLWNHSIFSGQPFQTGSHSLVYFTTIFQYLLSVTSEIKFTIFIHLSLGIFFMFLFLKHHIGLHVSWLIHIPFMSQLSSYVFLSLM